MSFVTVNLVKFYHDYLVDQKLVCIFAIKSIAICLKGRNQTNEFTNNIIYEMYFDYTPPVYPVTITYEWTIDSRNNLIEFPGFWPQTNYDVIREIVKSKALIIDL